MANSNDYYQQIAQLLRFDKQNVNFQLGVELLKSSMDVNLVIKFLSTGFYDLGYFLVPLFQEQPEFWEEVKVKLPLYIQNDILKFLPHRILYLEKQTAEAFYDLANQLAQEYYGEFPLLTAKIITEVKGGYCHGSESGSAVENGIGWYVHLFSEDTGPAEVIHSEEWTARAYHPKGNLVIKREYRNHEYYRVWMEKEGW